MPARSNVDGFVWDESRLANPHGQPDKAARVRAMFDSIAPTYERVNRMLSAGRDAAWRRAAVRMAGVTASDSVLDLACGTGDFARAFAAARPARVVGGDFAMGMLRHAVGRDGDVSAWCQADALRLPFADGSFSIASCAFGVRNFQDLAGGLGEMHRVLAPGGRAVILEFSVPRSRLWATLYMFYFHRVLPRVASILSGDRTGAYRYLPRSVTSFVDGRGMVEALTRAGFARVECRSLTFGIVTVYVGYKFA